MNKLNIKTFKNVYGIKELKITNNDKSLHNALIYASNGTFKTTFAKAIYEYKNNREVEDRITNIKSSIDIDISGKDLNNGNCLVFSREILDSYTINKSKDNSLYDDISKIAVSDDVSKELLEFKNDLEDIENEIKDIFQELNFIFEDARLFSNVENNKINFLIELVDNVITNNVEAKVLVDKETFNSKPYIALDNSTTRAKVSAIKSYIQEKDKDNPFDDDFSVFQVDEFLKTIKNTSFVNQDKGRKIIFNNITYNDYESLEKDVHNYVNDIITENELKDIQSVLKTIGARSNQQKEIRQDVLSNINIINALSFKRSDIIAYELNKNYHERLITLQRKLNLIKDDIDKLEEKIASSQSKFKNVLRIYKDRFNPIFELKIINEFDTLLDIDLPIIEISHSKQVVSEDILNQILSAGEKTTYNILKFIFKYDLIKENKPVLIFDDVIETFDYANRYAFIEYLTDMIKVDQSNVIILTSNFDFFKTIKFRIPIMKTYRATKTTHKNVIINGASGLIINTKQIFEVNSIADLLYMLPFVRELKDLTNDNPNNLVRYFHIKPHHTKLTINGLIKNTTKYIKEENLNLKDKNKKYHIAVQDEAEKLKGKSNLKLNEKIVLALATRLKLEKILIDGNISILSNITKNQTRELYEINKGKLLIDFKRLVIRILITTPEFIHLNGFMYEPLIDIDSKTLTKAYKDLIDFENDREKVWRKKFR